MAGVNDVIQVVAQMALLGQTIENVFEFLSVDATPDEDIMDDLAQFLEQNVYGQLLNQLDTELTFEQLEFRNVTDNLFMGQLDWPALTAGVSAADALPMGAAALITFPTAVPKVRGRKFFGGLTEVNNGNGVFVTSLVDQLIIIGAAMVGSFVGDVTATSVYIPGVVRSNGSFAPFLEALATNVPAYQRRRKQGVGS